jgi:hypothetical protein
MSDVHGVVRRAAGILLGAIGLARGRLPPRCQQGAVRSRRQTVILRQVLIAHGLHAQRGLVAAELDVIRPELAVQDEELAVIELWKHAGQSARELQPVRGWRALRPAVGQHRRGCERGSGAECSRYHARKEPAPGERIESLWMVHGVLPSRKTPRRSRSTRVDRSCCPVRGPHPRWEAREHRARSVAGCWGSRQR